MAWASNISFIYFLLVSHVMKRGQAAIKAGLQSSVFSLDSSRPLRGQAAIKSTSSTAGTLHGQAAMEYLFTYGWAILAVLAVIAALSFTGVFSTSQFISEQCIFQPDFTCTNYILVANQELHTSSLKFQIANGFGAPVKFLKVSARIGGGVETEGAVTGENPVTTEGSTQDFEVVFAGNPSQKGSIKDVLVKVDYINCANYLPDCESENPGTHGISGKIIATVE